MTPEELRQKLMARIDALLARTFLVYGEDRALLSALRGYVAEMTAPELDKVLTHMVRHGSTGNVSSQSDVT